MAEQVFSKAGPHVRSFHQHASVKCISRRYSSFSTLMAAVSHKSHLCWIKPWPRLNCRCSDKDSMPACQAILALTRVEGCLHRLAGMMLSQLVIGRFLKERAPLVDSPVPDLFDKSQDAKVATAVLNPMLSCLRRPWRRWRGEVAHLAGEWVWEGPRDVSGAPQALSDSTGICSQLVRGPFCFSDVCEQKPRVH